MHKLPRLLALTAAIAALLGAFAPPARTDCVAPVTLLGARRSAPGDTLAVRGKYWAAECNDVIVCSPGCGGRTCTGGEPSPPVSGITLLLRPVGDTPGGGRVLKEAIDANDRFVFRVDVSIPGDVIPGRYVIVATSATTGETTSRTLRVG